MCHKGMSSYKVTGCELNSQCWIPNDDISRFLQPTSTPKWTKWFLQRNVKLSSHCTAVFRSEFKTLFLMLNECFGGKILCRLGQLYIYLLLHENKETTRQILFIYRLPLENSCLPPRQNLTLCFISVLLYISISTLALVILTCSLSWSHVLFLILYLRSSIHYPS